MCLNCEYITKLKQVHPENTKIYDYYISHCEPKVCCERPDPIELDLIVCQNCGIVLDKIITNNQSNFNDSADVSVRASYETVGMQNYGLSTSISGSTRISQLNKQNYHMSHKQKVVYELYSQLNRFDLQGITEKYINQAIQFFIDITGIGDCPKDRKYIFKGKRRKGMIAVCLWLSFQKFGNPRCIEDLSLLMNVDKKTFYQELKRYNTLMGTSWNLEYSFDTIYNSYLSKLEIDYRISRFVWSVISGVKDLNVIKGKPRTIITSVVYWILLEIDLDKSRLVPSYLGVSLVTIQKNVETLKTNKKGIFCYLKREYIKQRFMRVNI